jgi:type II secretion system protein I
MTMRRKTGFTLIETLVALVIVAVSLAAAVRAAAISAESAQAVRAATYAMWAAQNRMAERRALGAQPGEMDIEMGGMRLYLAEKETRPGVWAVEVFDRPEGHRLAALEGR